MIDPFNPNSGYEVPKPEKKYLQFEEGGTEFMPLASPITGYEYWNTDNKPIRSAEPFEEMPIDIRNGRDGNPERIKHFWALPVYDFNPKARIKVKVLEISQKTVMDAILAYTKNPKWGSPALRYSFTVHRDDSGDITKYTVMANPTSEVPEEITQAWEAVQNAGFDINRLYSGGDPFKDTSNVD